MHPIQARLEQLAPSLNQEKIIRPSYSDIVLTEEEKEEALRLAREKKYGEIKKQEWFESISKQPVFRHYNADELLTAIKQCRTHTGKKVVVDDENINQVRELCFYFAGDARFNGNLEKGLLLMGKLGTGKTLLLSLFQHNQIARFSVVKCRTVENAWINESKEQDIKVLDYYSTNRPLPANENKFGHTTAGWCFDDLGSESKPSKRFGEEKNVLEEVLLNRYDNRLPFNTTHITTNLNTTEIEKVYGSRVRERLREMCNVITFTGESRRV
jgi:DNA replication protein DnaC